MRKKTEREHQRFCRLARKRTRKKIRRNLIVQGYELRVPIEFRSKLILVAPKVMSLNTNYEETIGFFRQFKTIAKETNLARKDDHCLFFPQVVLSFNGIEHLSVRTAVMFVAEVDRFRQVLGCNLSFSGKIDTAPLSLLRDVGFFSLFDLPVDSPLSGVRNDDKILIPLLSGTKVNAEEFDKIESALQQVFLTYKTSHFLYEGLSEAVTNVVHHAYITRYDLEFPCPGHRWWASACYDPIQGLVRFFVYDQGHGIPTTLPNSTVYEQVSQIIGQLTIGKKPDDVVMLKAAVSLGRTRTEQTGRGRGFSDMIEAVENTPGASIRIASGRAEVTCSGEHAIEVMSRECHLGGTLIEWNIPVTAF